MILLLTYLAGYALTWRYMVGFMIDDFAFDSKPDLEAILFGLLIGSLVNITYPIIAIWKVFDKIIDNRNFDIYKIFPKPKERL